jgi:enoyl-CoA hydratase
MEMCLTGRMMGAVEAEQSGLVSKVVPVDSLIDEAMKMAEVIAGMPPLAALANKELVAAAYETMLTQGIAFEKRLFNGVFTSEDRVEGMTAFADKRKPVWKGR